MNHILREDNTVCCTRSVMLVSISKYWRSKLEPYASKTVFTATAIETRNRGRGYASSLQSDSQHLAWQFEGT